MSLADEVLKKTDIVDVIGKRIPLVLKGNNYKGICPFHNDTSPSLTVSPSKQIYKCFACGASGNAYTFLMNYEHLTFKEALKYLGDEVGVSVGNINIEKKSKYEDLYKAYEFAVKYYQNNLASSDGHKALEYLNGRGIDSKLIKEFNVGLSLDSKNSLTSLLVKKGYDYAKLNDIGLSSDNRDIYVNRIMFPLTNVDGRFIGFSGRIYDSKSDNKYINTKEGPIFKKRELLYHYHESIEAVRSSKSIIIMEGFMDVIRACSVGINNCVALMGTSLTDFHIDLISRLTKNIYICLDGDPPGVHASMKAGEQFLDKGIEVKIIELPNPDDPDSYILREGKNNFEALIDVASNFNEYKIKKLKEDIDSKSSIDVSRYVQEVILQLSRIDDEIRIEIELKKLAKEYDLSYNTLEKQLSDVRKNKKVEVSSVDINKIVPLKKRKDKYTKAIEQLLYLMITNEWVISRVASENLLFPEHEQRLLSNEIIYYYKQNGRINIADFITHCISRDDINGLLNEIVSSNYTDKANEEEVLELFECIKNYVRKMQIENLKVAILKEVNPLKQAEIANKIMKIRLGESIDD